MRFLIKRTSDYDGVEKPCEKAKLVKPYNPQENAIECKGVWEIEINSLEELIVLSNDVGAELIVSVGSIEIYDDWRE
jgi:hypothetical protein